MAVSVSVTVTVPDVVINSNVVMLKIEERLKKRTGPDMMRLFNKTTEGWEHKINFYQRMAHRPSEISVTVFTRFKLYALLNEGSPKHPIPARRGGLLRFQKGYKAATQPGILRSSAKQRSGPWWTAREVDHPGFDAREFDVAVAEDIAPRFADDVQDAISIGSSIFI